MKLTTSILIVCIISFELISCGSNRNCPGYVNDNSEWFIKQKTFRFISDDNTDTINFNGLNGWVIDSTRSYSFSKDECSHDCPNCASEYAYQFSADKYYLRYTIGFRIKGDGRKSENKTATISFDISEGPSSCCQTQIYPDIKPLAFNGTYLNNLSLNGTSYSDVIFIQDAHALIMYSKCLDLYYAKKYGIIKFKFRSNEKFYTLR